jgi:hypothetical protein
MGRKRDIVLSIRPTEKNLVYLTSAGYIDGRNGKKKSEALNINEMINDVVRLHFEKYRKPLQDQVTNEQLQLALLDHEINKQQKMIDQAAATMRVLNDQRDRILHPREEEDPQLVLQVFLKGQEIIEENPARDTALRTKNGL